MLKPIKSVLLLVASSLFLTTACQGSADIKDNNQTTKQVSTDHATEAGTDSVDDSESDGASGNLNLEGFPIVNETITLTAMVNRHSTQPEWGDILAWQEYEKMTNIKIEWDSVPSTSVAEKRNLALATNNLPDLFYRASVPDADVAKYGAEGAFIELNDLIASYAPNFTRIMEEFDDVRKGIPMADGKIYSFPGLSNTLPVEINPKLYINQKWLSAVGEELPTTTDELFDVLVAFRDGDPNKNGINDEIPWTASSLENILRTLRGSYGLQNRGFGAGNFDIDPETNEMRYLPTSEAYRDMVTFINKLYSEGLIDQEIFTMNLDQILAKNEQELLGAFSFTNTASSANKNEDDFVGLEVALEGPNGDQLWTAVRGHVAGKGGFIITTANEYPEASVRWIDYFYGDEGAKLIYMGVEAVSYEQVGDNEYKILDEIANNIPDGSSYDQVISAYVPYAGGGIPTMSNEVVFKGGEMHPIAYQAAMNMVPFIPGELWAPFSFTADELSAKAEIETDLNAYVNSKLSEFINGTTPLSAFDDYVKEIENMRFEEYMEIQKAAYARYQEN